MKVSEVRPDRSTMDVVAPALRTLTPYRASAMSPSEPLVTVRLKPLT